METPPSRTWAGSCSVSCLTWRAARRRHGPSSGSCTTHWCCSIQRLSPEGARSMEDLKGRSALVTGASTGIGAAVAIAYAARGMRVAVHYNSSADAAEQVVSTIRAAGGEAFVLQADVRDSAAILRV